MPNKAGSDAGGVIKRKILIGLGLVTIVIALAYVARPTGHIPLYDANLVRLAESPLQGYCAGETLMKTQNYDGDKAKAAACRGKNAGAMSDNPNISKVEYAFCRAIVANGFNGSVNDCLGILSMNQLWPTYDGGITDQWNRARPYPRSAIQVVEPKPDGSRTGGRSGLYRVGGGGL